MAKSHEIKVARRDVQGKGASRRLRHAGVIPGIVYGGDLEPVMVEFNHNEIWLAQHNEWFYSSIITLNLDGTTQQVLLRDLQRHPFKQQIMHLDFQRVNENETLRTAVPLHFLNEDKSPAGKSAEVVVTHELNEVVVECLPKDLPEFIEIDLADLAIGAVVHLSDVKLPAGVVIPELKLGKEHDVAVVIAKHGKEEAEEAPVESAEVPAAKVAKKDDK